MNKTYEAEKKYTYKVELDTMSDVREFVKIATACDEKILLKTETMTVNAKSLLGVMLARKFSWQGIILESAKDHYYEFRRFIVNE